jgi:hypothetical protein
VKATLIKTAYDRFTFKRLPDERVEIEAPSQDELFALFFREYVNRYKYVNSVHYRLADTKLANAYSAWIADVRNYAAHGGDMW